MSLVSTEGSLRALEAIGQNYYPPESRSPVRPLPVVTPPAVWVELGDLLSVLVLR